MILIWVLCFFYCIIINRQIHFLEVFFLFEGICFNINLLIPLFLFSLAEGLAVGVGFGAIGKTPSATFESAVYV